MRENKGDNISYLLKTSAAPLTPLIASQLWPGKPATQRMYEDGSARSEPSWQQKVTTTCDHVNENAHSSLPLSAQRANALLMDGRSRTVQTGILEGLLEFVLQADSQFWVR